MTRAHSCWVLAALTACACTGSDEIVFADLQFGFEEQSSVAAEGAGLEQVWVTLSGPAPMPLSVKFAVSSQMANLAIGASEEPLTCRRPDLLLQDVNAVARDESDPKRTLSPNRFEGELNFGKGERRKAIELWLVDDAMAEADEPVELELVSASAGELVASRHVHTVVDDDRQQLLDVTHFGADDTGQTDATQQIQAALDSAATAQGNVVYFPPGDYLVRALRLSSGMVLVGYGARLVRPEAAGAQTRTLTLSHSSEVDSLETHISGLAIDGRRDAQGVFEDSSLVSANLINVASESATAGRAVVSMEDVTLMNGPGDGIVLGGGTKANLCDIVATDVWADAVRVSGGGTQVKLTGFAATGQLGTTGIVIDAIDQFLNSRRVEFSMHDAVLGTGDIEIIVRERSEIHLSRVVMDDNHFSLSAQDSEVRVENSLIRFGLADAQHNRLIRPGSVRFSNSDLYLSEVFGKRETREADREAALISVAFGFDRGTPRDLSFVNCRFHVDSNFETSDTVYVAEVVTPGPWFGLGFDRDDDGPESPGGTLSIEGGSFDPRFDEVFAPDCNGCTFKP